MKKIIQKILVQNLHFLIIIYITLNRFDGFTTHLQGVESKDAEIATVVKKRKNLAKRKERMEAFAENLEESKLRLKDVEKEIESVRKLLPGEISDAEVLDFFSGEASLLNIKNITLRPQAEENRGFYIAKQYEIRGTGTYLQFLIYFDRMRKNPRPVDITAVTMTSSPSRENKGRFHLLDFVAKMEVFGQN